MPTLAGADDGTFLDLAVMVEDGIQMLLARVRLAWDPSDTLVEDDDGFEAEGVSGLQLEIFGDCLTFRSIALITRQKLNKEWFYISFEILK